MKVLIVYHLRLGDVIRTFPIAWHLAQQGHEVFIECDPQYWGIFDTISYAKPVLTGADGGWGRVYRPQVWPARYEEFRASGTSWPDFVYKLYPEWVGLDRTIRFDRMDEAPDPRAEYGLPERYVLIFPQSFSTPPTPIGRLLSLASLHIGLEHIRLVMDEPANRSMQGAGWPTERLLTARHLSHLPRLIRDAHEVLTVNTSATIIASAVRRHYFHVASKDPQENWTAPNQTVLAP